MGHEIAGSFPGVSASIDIPNRPEPNFKLLTIRLAGLPQGDAAKYFTFSYRCGILFRMDFTSWSFMKIFSQ